MSLAPSKVYRANDIVVADLVHNQDSASKTFTTIEYGGNRIVLQLPTLRAPFGISKWKGNAAAKTYLDLSLDDATLLGKLREIDDWAKTLYSTKRYVPLIRPSKNSAFAPTLRLTLPQVKGKFTCDVYDAARNKLNIDSLDIKGRNVAAIIDLHSLWSMADTFGIQVKVNAMKLLAPQQASGDSSSLSGFAFVDE